MGLSHRSAPVAILERAALTGEAQGKLLRDVIHSEHVAGTFAVSTCNRVEVYAEVVEGTAERLVLARDGERPAHLPEDLALAHHHGFQAARHRQQVLHRAVLVVHVQVRGEFRQRDVRIRRSRLRFLDLDLLPTRELVALPARFAVDEHGSGREQPLRSGP